MRYLKGFVTLDVFSFRNNLRYAIGDEFVHIQRKFLRPKAEDIISRLEGLKELGVTLKKIKYFKDTKELKNIEIEVDEDFYAWGDNLNMDCRSRDIKIVEVFRYIYNHGFDIQFDYYEPDWQHQVGGIWSRRIKFIRIGKESYMNSKIDYNNQYNQTYNLIVKYKTLYNSDFPLEDSTGRMSMEEKFIMWLRHQRGKEIQIACIKPGWSQHPDQRGTIYCDHLGYEEHPFFDYNRTFIKDDEYMKIRDVDRSVVEFIWGTVAFIHEKNYPFVNSRYCGDRDYFFEYTICKF